MLYLPFNYKYVAAEVYLKVDGAEDVRSEAGERVEGEEGGIVVVLR